MLTAAVGFLAGVGLLHRLPELPDSRWAWLLLLAPLVAMCRLRTVRVLLWAAVGFLWALGRAHLLLADYLPEALEGRDLRLQGVVASVPIAMERGVRFELEPRTLVYDGHLWPVPGRVRLTWYSPAPEIHAGDVWQLTVRLKRPHGFMNPGGFDYERALLQQRIRATGYVRAAGENALLVSSALNRPLDRVRQSIYDAIVDGRPEPSLWGLVAALAVGERAAIDPTQWQVLGRTGTSHLMAISGLHIGLVAGLAFWLVRWLWVLPAGLALRWPAPKAAALGAVAAAAGYAALAGFSIPTQRALVMVLTVMFALLTGRDARPAHTLALALLLVLVWDPFAFLAAGFWLSFAAVAVIFYGAAGRVSAGRWWKRWGRLQWRIALGLLPLTLFLFQRVALAAPLANLVAIPWVGFLVVPPTLAGSLLLLAWPTAGEALLQAAHACLSLLWTVLERIAGLDFLVWVRPAPPLWTVAAACIGVAWLMAPRGIPGRWVGAVWALPLLLIRPEVPAEGAVRMTLLDVGQGLAAVVQTRQHVLLYDAGPRFSPRFDAGSAVVVPFLRHVGVERLDMLILSHPDNDHWGGADAVIQTFEVADVLTSAPRELPGVGAHPCRTGQAWRWDGVLFRVLHPPPGAGTGGNNASCVLHLQARGGSILLPGDIERDAERSLVAAGRLPHADVVVAPHHGSGTSSTIAFVQALQADFALFATGYRNRFHFPRSSVVERYRAAGSVTANTAEAGAVTVVVDDTGVSLESYRRSAPHWWSGR